MNDTKNFLASKTLQGILVMVLTFLFGDQFGDPEYAQIAEGVAILAGGVWALWGRVTADKKLTLGKGKSGLMASLALVLAVSVTGCAGKTAIEQVAEMPGSDQARFYAGQLAQTWLDLDDGYRDAWVTASAKDKKWMSENLKPAIETAKPVVDSLVSTAKAWTVAAKKCPDGVTTAETDNATMAADLALCDETRSKYEGLYKEAVNVLAQAQSLYTKLTAKE
jgi:hypothetical protein